MGNPALRLFDVLNTYSIMNGKIHQIEKDQIEINIFKFIVDVLWPNRR